MRLLIAGGSIAGLSLSLISKYRGYTPIIIERKTQQQMSQSNIGGGIGLWPPALQILQQLNLLQKLQSKGQYMPTAIYYDTNGNVIGKGTDQFINKFPVLCLNRDHLMKTLFNAVRSQSIQVISGSSISDIVYSGSQIKNSIIIKNQEGKSVQGDILIGCDGINSIVRDYMCRLNQIQRIVPKHCGYTYFRAVTKLSKECEAKLYQHSFQIWGENKRFGYVPLHRGQVFWFVAIPIGTKMPKNKKLEELAGSIACNNQIRQWIFQLFRNWKAPIQISKIIELTQPSDILRTDIRKIQGVTRFPWNYKDKIFIIGDAANATAPNLAQGAGLALESAWDFVKIINFQGSQSQKINSLNLFFNKRRQRAEKVQRIADLIADLGQLTKYLSLARNIVMRNSVVYFPFLEKAIFENIVKYSLGGNAQSLYWNLIPINQFSSNMQSQSRNQLTSKRCMMSKLLGIQKFKQLPIITRQFRSYVHGSGSGIISVQSIKFSHIFGLPKSMKNVPFGAYTDTYFDSTRNTFHQRWTRVFGEGLPSAKKYQTFHYLMPSVFFSNTGYILGETLGSWLNIFRFGYSVRMQAQKITYKSRGLWIGPYRIYLPSFLFPSSSWVQTQTKDGWKFDGIIKLPKLLGEGTLMKYYGNFIPEKQPIKLQNKKIVTIAGGTGMIGSLISKKFYRQNWEVRILTRKRQENQKQFHYATLKQWDPMNSLENIREIDNLSQFIKSSDVIINLSGQNPGAQRWTLKVQQNIQRSRLSSIKMLSQAIKQSNNQNLTFIQASAAGIYGDRKNQILNEKAKQGNEETFRVKTCKNIELLSKKLINQTIIVRIGHALSSQSNLLKALKAASFLGMKQFGKGGQYIPWVHIEDIAESIFFISENRESLKNKYQTLNICSPQQKTYNQILQAIKNPNHLIPNIISIPQSILKITLGQMSSVILDSQRMVPSALLEAGYKFKYQDLQHALRTRQCLF